jgi:hypothetical protein
MRPTRPPVELSPPPRRLLRMVNPLIRALLRSPAHRLVGSNLVLLSMTGRRSGRTITIPLGAHELDGQLVVLTGAPWRHNLRGGAPVEVTRDGKRSPGRADLNEDPRAVARAYREAVKRVGTGRARWVGLRINVDRLPTLEEFEAAVGDRSFVRIDFDEKATSRP